MKTFLATVLALLMSAPAAAQVTRADSATRFLEVMLARLSPTGESPVLSLSTPAKDLVDLLGDRTPRAALGSMSSDGAAITIYERTDPGALLDSIADVLVLRGWARDDDARHLVAPAGLSKPVLLCSGDTIATLLSVTRSPDTESLIVTQLSNTSGICAPGVISGGRPEQNVDRPALPDLRPLPGGEPGAFSYGGSGADWYFERFQETTLALDDVFQFYSAALATAGWRIEAPAHGTQLVAANISVTGQGGDTWVGLLTVSPGARLNEVAVRIALDSPAR